MTPPLTKRELKSILEKLEGTAFDPAIMLKLAKLQAEAASKRERGALVFQWLLPLSLERTVIQKRGPKAGQPKKLKLTLCPRLNEYASMKMWARTRLYNELDRRIRETLSAWPRALLRGDMRPRAVHVSRHSSAELDEMTVDSGGGKVPIDRLVQLGVLRGDAPQDLEREASWRKAAPGKGSLLIEVFELV